MIRLGLIILALIVLVYLIIKYKTWRKKMKYKIVVLYNHFAIKIQNCMEHDALEELNFLIYINKAKLGFERHHILQMRLFDKAGQLNYILPSVEN